MLYQSEEFVINALRERIEEDVMLLPIIFEETFFFYVKIKNLDICLEENTVITITLYAHYINDQLREKDDPISQRKGNLYLDFIKMVVELYVLDAIEDFKKYNVKCEQLLQAPVTTVIHIIGDEN